MAKRSLWLLAYLPMLVAARNCSVHPISDNEVVGWQPGGCYRGTWTIVSTCLSTIIACTWSIQHLNIPATGDSPWSRNKRKMKWMLITVLFPELVLIQAILEFHMAWKALRLMSDNSKSVKWPWWSQFPSFLRLPTRRHYPASKGEDLEGQAVEGLESQGKNNIQGQVESTLKSQDGRISKDQDVRGLKSQEDTDGSKKRTWTLTHCYFANMGGFVYTAGGQQLLVSAQQLAKVEDTSYACPEITEEDIKDKSKQDWLAKLFAALQISQLILSIITRRIQGLHFSQFETVTLSFAICGVLIYCTYFHKPQKIEQAIELKHATSEATAHFLTLQSEKTFDSFWAIMLNKRTDEKETDSSKNKALRIPNDNVPSNKGTNDVHPAVYLLALASGLFGAIHAIAWKFEFPTEEEKLLWQIATCISAASPVVGLMAIPLSQLTKAAGDPKLFVGNCLRVMQEYSWHTANISWVNDTIKALENSIIKDESKAYSEIFRKPGGDTLTELRDFMDRKGRFHSLDPKAFELHDDKLFAEHFRRLISSMMGKETKKTNEAAWTDKWPRKPLLPQGINQGILYITGFLYCASRLILLAVSISSIRKMPGSVYIVTDWTRYLPTFGAMGG